MSLVLLSNAVSLGLGSSSVSSQPLEIIPATEERAIEEIVALALAELQKRYGAEQSLVRRDAHAKDHGCVKALFRVSTDLAPDLRVGLASKSGQDYKAWVRFSNGAFEPGPDAGMDGRGMAFKIMSAPTAGKESTAHDILMINHPVFFSPNADDYLDFARAGALTGDGGGLKRYFMPSLNPWRWRVRQGLIAYGIASQTITSPLAIQYFSMVPFMYGPGRVVKFSARPCSAPSEPTTVDRTKNNFLRDAMRQELQGSSACFVIMVQERRGDMPIEDATVEWRQSESPFRPIGTIEIPAQEFESAERAVFCENTAFSPWNAPDEHRPIGGINRIRKVLYEEISRYRRSRSRAVISDPLEAWDRL